MRNSPYAVEIRGIYQAALLVFVVTVVLGILNGMDLINFSRDVIQTHVHAGTLGWLTLSVIATSLWVFSENGETPVSRGATRAMAWLAGLSVVAYVLAFYSGSFPARAILALPVVLAILWFLAWIWRAMSSGPRSMPRVGIVAAVFMLLVGATIGTLIQIQWATGTAIFPAGGDMIGGHAVAMVFSYLILFGMVVAEWQLVGVRPGSLPRGGIAQISFLLLAGVVAIVALIFDIQAVLPLTILLEIAAVVTFLVRLGRPIMSAAWGTAGAARQFGLSAVFIVVDVVLVIVTIAVFISIEGDINQFPLGLIAATDHTTFIGVMTNAIFALLLIATARPGRSGGDWLAQVTFWGMNIGLIGFMIGLLGDTRTQPEIAAGVEAGTQILKQIFTPIMGVSILVAVGVFFNRLRSPDGG